MRRQKRALLPLAALTALTIASTAGAQQSIEQLRARLIIPAPAATGLETELGRFPRGAPGTSTGAPGAFGANWNDAYVGVGFQSGVRYSEQSKSDGTVSAGFGFGDASDIVGVDATITFLSTVRSGFGNRMGMSLKVHKLLPDNIGVAIGVNGVQFQPNEDDRNAVYAVVSKVMSLESAYTQSFTWSLGLGNGAFQTASSLNAGKNSLGVFGSGALRLGPQWAVIADWPGQDLNIGVSYVPFPAWPLVFTPSLNDLTGASNAGVTAIPGSIKRTGPRFSLGVGFAMKLMKPKKSTSPEVATVAQVATETAIRAGVAAGAAQVEEKRRVEAVRVADAARAEETRRAAAAAQTARDAAARRAAAAPPPVPPARVEEIKKVRASLTATVSISAVLTPDQKAILDGKIAIMKANPQANIRAAGHTDERGTDASNMKVGLARATTVKQYMVSKGIAATRIEAMSYGKSRPIDPGHTAAAWAKNRRVEIEVTSGGDNLVPAPAPAAKAPAPAAKSPATKTPAEKTPAL
jgi:outer membrane protein OmpA-like peptidoglycan-associated protein